MTRTEIKKHCKDVLAKEITPDYCYFCKIILQTIEDYEKQNPYSYDINGKRYYSGKGKIEDYFYNNTALLLYKELKKEKINK